MTDDDNYGKRKSYTASKQFFDEAQGQEDDDDVGLAVKYSIQTEF
jgi:hypothetical protein